MIRGGVERKCFHAVRGRRDAGTVMHATERVTQTYTVKSGNVQLFLHDIG